MPKTREVRVTPHFLHWSAFYVDAPYERAMAESPEAALQGLRDLAAKREVEFASLRKQAALSNLRTVIAVVVAVIIGIYIVNSMVHNATAAHASSKIYAHRVLKSDRG